MFRIFRRLVVSSQTVFEVTLIPKPGKSVQMHHKASHNLHFIGLLERFSLVNQLRLADQHDGGTDVMPIELIVNVHEPFVLLLMEFLGFVPK